MNDSERETILVSVDLSAPPVLSQPLLRQLVSLDVFLLGWQEGPDQTSLEQAEQEYEEEAREALQGVATSFEEEGVEVRSQLVFTHDRFDAIERVAVEEECDAVLIPRPSTQITRLLLSLRGMVNADRMARIAGRLAGKKATVTVLHVAEGSEEPADADKTLLEEAARLLVHEGISEDRIDRCSVRDGAPAEAVNERAQQGDLVMIGESAPSSGGALLSSRSERIAREAPAPVLIVKHVHDEHQADPATRAAGR